MQSHRVVTSVDKEDDRELLTPPVGWFEPISLWVSRPAVHLENKAADGNCL